MKLSALLAPLIARKADHDAIMDVVLAFEAEQLDGLTKRRENDAKRQAEKRKRDESHVTSRDVTVTANSHASASPAPNLENKQTNKEERKQDSAPVARGGIADFQAELSTILDAEHIEAICAVRRKKGATFSALAGRGLVKALRACPDITAAADEMVLRNWTGIKPDWLESRGRQNGHSPPIGKRQNAVEAMEEIFRDKGWTQEDEQEFIPSRNGDAQRLPSERRSDQGAIVDLRPGADWRARSGH